MLTEGMYVGGRYEVISKIGTGGMSDVYKAKDHTLGRFVAIKVLKPEFSEDINFVTKFRSEAQAAAGLEHPNIVNIYDVGSENGMHYIIMEYVEGVTLKTYIEKKGQLTFKEAVSIAIQVGRGIEAAHNKGIIHRDIKPQNIMISKEGKVKVTDFGIARAATSNTISSDVMGSVHYASPEQTRNGFVDGKSDIYSLGIVMYEMVTGRVPFDGDTTVAVAIQHLQEEIVPPSAYAPNLPVSMEKIILKCTQKNPDRRYETMTALAADLRKVLISPDEDFVVIAPLSQDRTRIIREDEIKKIKKETSTIYLSEEEKLPKRERYEKQERYQDEDESDDYEDENSSGVNPKMDKAITIMGIGAGLIIVALIIFISVSFLGDFKFGSSSSDKNNTQTSQDDVESLVVPDIRGYTFEEAKAELNARGLGIRKTSTAASEIYDAGEIISQSPEALTKTDPNTTVEVVISSGKGETSIPSVTGMDESDAYNALVKAGFTPVKEYVYSDSVEQGVVIEQSPKANNLAKTGENVEIVISRGKEQTAEAEKPQEEEAQQPEPTGPTVPNITGMTQEEAKEAIKAAGYTTGSVTSAYSDTVPLGQVISQSPLGKTAAEEGTAIDFIISSGKKEEPQENQTPQQDGQAAEEETQKTYRVRLFVKAPESDIVAAANIYLYDGLDGSGTILEQWTNQPISSFGTDGYAISKSGMQSASGSLKIEWLDAAGNVINPQIESPISFEEE